MPVLLSQLIGIAALAMSVSIGLLIGTSTAVLVSERALPGAAIGDVQMPGAVRCAYFTGAGAFELYQSRCSFLVKVAPDHTI